MLADRHNQFTQGHVSDPFKVQGKKCTPCIAKVLDAAAEAPVAAAYNVVGAIRVSPSQLCLTGAILGAPVGIEWVGAYEAAQEVWPLFQHTSTTRTLAATVRAPLIITPVPLAHWLRRKSDSCGQNQIH
jgi:hypothetical protein